MLAAGARRHRLTRTWVGARRDEPDILLALDWGGGSEKLLIGRHPSCDVVVADVTVSRRHAKLTFRDGSWIIQDLDSTNGTRLNGKLIGRCRLRPGDELMLGRQRLQVD